MRGQGSMQGRGVVHCIKGKAGLLYFLLGFVRAETKNGPSTSE